MPYAIEKQDDKFCVINKDTGKVMGTHATRAKAEAQMSALYANEPEAAKSGNRNNKRDRFTIRTIRAQALALAELTKELEPTDDDEQADEPETDAVMESLASLIGDNTMLKSLNLSYAKSINPNMDFDTLAIKRVGQDLIRHPVFLWGNPNQTDLEREFFTRDSEFWDAAQGKTRPLTWDHAQDKSFDADPLIGMTVEWEDDEIGRWAISQLDKTHKYRKAIDKLIDAKMLGSAPIASPVLGASSDSAPQYVERVQVGKSIWLKRWPWFATALTPQPCEPRMIDAKAGVSFLKSHGISLPDAPDMARELELLQLRTRVLKIKGA